MNETSLLCDGDNKKHCQNTKSKQNAQ